MKIRLMVNINLYVHTFSQIGGIAKKYHVSSDSYYEKYSSNTITQCVVGI